MFLFLLDGLPNGHVTMKEDLNGNGVDMTQGSFDVIRDPDIQSSDGEEEFCDTSDHLPTEVSTSIVNPSGQMSSS